jgi:hypothetical protein
MTPPTGSRSSPSNNGHHHNWCYLPIVATLTFNDEVEQYVVGVVLRPGNAHASRGAIGILRRLLAKLRRAFPKARLRVRLDGGFATPEVLDFLEDQEVEYLVAIAKNPRLEPRGRQLLAKARRRAKQSGETAHFYGETPYAARKWQRRKQRVIYKTEVVCLSGREPRDNLRFVVTNLSQSPRRVYQIYRERGDDENRIKELHYGLKLDRTSCSRFLANQLRVLLTTAAYVLMQELRRQARGTACQAAQVTTLRERLLKLGAWVEVAVRRVVVHLPSSFAWAPCWMRIAARVGAVPG